jgi:Holliday junction resolvasome RuvABC endonuclease subunit
LVKRAIDVEVGRAQISQPWLGLSREIPITEYEPKKIKMAITGNGNTSKSRLRKCCSNYWSKNLAKT